jgi:hypothetical protein
MSRELQERNSWCRIGIPLAAKARGAGEQFVKVEWLRQVVGRPCIESCDTIADRVASL